LLVLPTVFHQSYKPRRQGAEPMNEEYGGWLAGRRGVASIILISNNYPLI
jgi:hypothetical protein